MISYGKHSINDDDIELVTRALKSDWLTNGPFVERFERELETVTGAPTIVVSSGTAALHCAYAAIGLEPGDEVITPPITFIATQATASLLGATVLFADVQSDTANIDPEKVEPLISERTKAVVAVDYAGHPADMDQLRKIADKHKIYLIEDAAHSIGSLYNDRPVGSIADVTTFSFFPTKNLTSGEGGAISSPSHDLLNKAREFSRQGLVRDPERFKLTGQGAWHQEVQEFGLNYRLPDILCALGISQLNRLNSFKARRREIFDYYSDTLQTFENLVLPTERSNVNSNWHLYPIRVPHEKRLEIFDAMRAKGIGVQVNYLPAHLQPVFQKQGYRRGRLPNSEAFYDSEISLPMHFELSEADLDYIIESLVRLL